MQEDQTVSFEPISDVGYFPWHAKLFALYLLVIVVIAAIRAGRILWAFSRSREAREARSEMTPCTCWKLSDTRAAGFTKLSHLTLLLNGTALAWSAANIFGGLKYVKRTSFAFIGRELADPLGTFALGLVVCAALYLCGMIFESAIRRRQKTD